VLDERWSPEVEEIAEALQRILDVESSPARVRIAERDLRGYDSALDEEYGALGWTSWRVPPNSSRALHTSLAGQWRARHGWIPCRFWR
jgi:hypothetical protein